jgi:glycosyltransferase involved in cell wall biosynthesis
MPLPKLSVILPTFDRAGSLKRALDALLRQTALPGSYEVIVVDNNSTDGTAGVVALFDDRRVRLVAEPRQGLSYARNTGLAAARGRIAAFTDDDVEVAPDWVETIVSSLGRHPHVAGLGGRVLPAWQSGRSHDAGRPDRRQRRVPS